MDIVIISQYLRNIENFKNNNSRFVYLANMLSLNNINNVEIITSNFLHGPKRFAKKVDTSTSFKTTVIEEPGYKKNVSLKRFYSHYILSKKIYKYLKKRKKPECIYCAVPSLDVAKAAALYCKKNRVRFILDIQDLWPEAFKMIFNIPMLNNLVFLPLTLKANYIYKHATSIIGVSTTYVNRGMQNNKNAISKAVFLGTNMKDFDSYKLPRTKDDYFNIAYCGSLSACYDLKCVIKAISILNEKGIKNLKFVVMGDGDKREEFIKYCEQLKVNHVFTGMLDYPEMVKKLCNCDIAVNPIRKGSAQSIINKVGDYAMAGLPVVSTQECPEYVYLLNTYKCGITCQPDDSEEIAKAIEKFYSNSDLRKEYSENSRKLGSEKFDRTTTYNEIVNIIINKDE